VGSQSKDGRDLINVYSTLVGVAMSLVGYLKRKRPFSFRACYIFPKGPL